MAYTLQSSGLATDLLYCLMIDEDGQTLKEFVNGWTSTTSDGGATWTDNNSADMTVDDGVLVSSSAWKSRTLDLFETKADGSFGYKGVRFPGEPALPGGSTGSGFTVFIAVAGASAGDGAALLFIAIDAENEGLERGSTDEAQWDVGAEFAGNTALPSDGTTAFSFGSYYQYNGDVPFFYGLESGSLSADGTPTTDGRSQTGLLGIGGGSGQGNQPHKPFIYAYFDRELTLTEMQSLHDDFFGTLFEAGGGTSASIDRVLETDTAQALTATKTKAIGRVSETGIAQTLARSKARSIGRATETDLARAFASAKALAIGLVSESATARTLTASKQRAIGQAAETDVARAVQVGGTLSAAIGRVTEADTARPLASSKARAVGRIAEADVAVSITAAKARSIGLVSEADVARALRSTKARAIGRVTETDLALALTAGRAVQLGLVTETDVARAFSAAKARGITAVAETDVALSFTVTGGEVGYLVGETKLIAALDGELTLIVPLDGTTTLTPALDGETTLKPN